MLNVTIDKDFLVKYIIKNLDRMQNKKKINLF